MTPLEKIIDALRGLDCRPQGRANQWQALCPTHPDRNPSLSIGQGQDGRALIHCHAGCDTDGILSALGMHAGDLFQTPRERPRPTDDTWLPCHQRRGPTGHEKTAEYPYRDPDGQLLYVVTRCASKCFAQYRPDPTSRSGKRWSINDRTTGRRLVPEGILYRLPEILAALRQKPPPSIYIVEGEKDANTLWTAGYPATCNSGGAGKWTPNHAVWLAGADVLIVADRDATGAAHAQHVSATLQPYARSIEILEPATGKDTTDHIQAGLPITLLRSVSTPKPPTEGGDLT